MFTQADKAITALVMAVLYLLNAFAGVDLGVPEETITALLAALTPVLVWLVPNKQA
jgi:hypothetical protein